MFNAIRARRAHRAVPFVVLAALAVGAVSLPGAAASVPVAAISPVAATASAPSLAAASTSLPGWLPTSGSTIRTATNKKYVIKAVAWFGMETSNCAPHGLWTIRLEDGLKQIRSMGFNSIRLPFSNECLAASATNSINFAKNPSLEGKSPLKVMDYVIAKAADAGLTVILDRHRPDSAAQSSLWYTDRYSEAKWISDWKSLAKRYKKTPSVIGFDLHNEPHGSACWGCGDKKTDWRAAATRAGNAVLSVNPNLLIIVEGVEKQSDSSYTWWGGGLAGAKAKPVKLAKAHRVVYSPHEYPASIFAQKWFSAPNYPNNLPGVWDASWGYLVKQNIAPVLVGEFGTKLETSSDKQWLKKLVTYLDRYGFSFAYWSFNPNSGDTGGLVKDDWTSPQTAKLAYLAPLLKSSGSSTTPSIAIYQRPLFPTPAPTATPAPTPTATPTPTPTTPANSTGTDGDASATFATQSSWAQGYIADITVQSPTAATGWTLSWRDPGATRIVSTWGMSCALKPSATITCTGSDWGAALAPGQPNRVGLQVESTTAPVSPALTLAVTGVR